MISKRSASKVLVVALLAAAGAACNDKGMTYGDANSVIAVTSPELWGEISEQVYGTLETTIQTVREEKMFTVTYQEPYAENWDNLRRFRQMLLVGTLQDPWMQEAIDEAEQPITEPGLYRVPNVWSRDQTVTLIVLPEGGALDNLQAQLTALHEQLDEQYRTFARSRMYLSGVDTALADTLAVEAGFSLVVPQVYQWRQTDSVYQFRNDQPDPAELIRHIAVTWITPASTELDTEDLLAWRDDLVRTHYPQTQIVVPESVTSSSFEFRGHPVYEVQAQWRNGPDSSWPAGGPFFTRALTCDDQDRTYLIDAWLYAPGKEKYQYMIQLETILETFRCGD